MAKKKTNKKVDKVGKGPGALEQEPADIPESVGEAVEQTVREAVEESTVASTSPNGKDPLEPQNTPTEVRSDSVTIESPKVEEPTSEPTSERTSIDEPQVPKKRLTLQERLALAAKAGKSKRIISDVKQKQLSPEPSSQTASTTPEPEIIVNGAADVSGREALPGNLQALSPEELVKLLTEAQNKLMMMESKNASLKEEKQSLQEKVKSLVSATTSTISSVSDHLLKEKDARIAQLLKEGEELSKKELKLNTVIKKVKSSEADYRYKLDDLRASLEASDTERKALKESLKLALDGEQQSTLRTKALQKQLDHEQTALKEEIRRTQQLSLNVEELSQTLIQEKNKFTGEINDLKRLVEKERQKLVLAREDHTKEITRLESKVEQLRLQAENALTSSSTTDESYLKLLRQHDVLQKQYTSATENWQSIEASLMHKINGLEQDVINVQAELTSSEKKSQVLAHDLETRVQKINSVSSKVTKLTSENARLETQLRSTSQKLEEALESQENNVTAFSKEKSSLQSKIQGLERQMRDQIQPQQLVVSDQPMSISSPSFSRNTSTPSLRTRSWETRDISLGESSSTPVQSRKSSLMFPPGFGEDHDNLSDIIDEDDTTSFNGSSHRNSASAVGGSNVQLLSKMSLQVRRLQTELATMKEEMERLSEEKKGANEEIVALMKDNEQVQAYKKRIAELEKQVNSSASRHDKTLEILGEKSEQVEELKADVQDLKELLRSQVQQFVEMQSR